MSSPDFSHVSHPLSYNMLLGHGILSERLRSNTFDCNDVEQSNRITESDLSWLLGVLPEEQTSSTEHISIDGSTKCYRESFALGRAVWQPVFHDLPCDGPSAAASDGSSNLMSSPSVASVRLSPVLPLL
jgi:hypothetical protein